MGEISVWFKGCEKNIGGVTHRTTAAEIVRFTLTECVWKATEKARRSGRCYALFENWRGCQRLIPPCKRIYKLWKLWGLERIHVKFVVKKVAMETLARKDFGEYVEASQLKVPKRHVAFRTQPHVLDTDDSDQTTSSDGVGLFIIDESDTEGGRSPSCRKKRMLLKHVLRQNDQLHTLCKTVEDVDEEILFYEAKLHHFRVVEDGNDYVQHAYLNKREEGASKGPCLNKHDQLNDLQPSKHAHLQPSKHGDHITRSDTLDSNKSQNQIDSDEKVMKQLSDSAGSKENVHNHTGFTSKAQTNLSPKNSTKIVIVNPLPRNEISSSDKKQTEEESLKSGDSRGAFTSKGLPVPRSKLPLSKSKRRTKNSNRSKRKVPGLYEFEQSCEWLKVMDKELKRLESMENLSFVDWDSESLLSEKQLTFASGNRKFKFRSAFSGEDFKKYDLNENLEKIERTTDLEQDLSKLRLGNGETPTTLSAAPDEVSEGAVKNKDVQTLCKSNSPADNDGQSVSNGVDWKGVLKGSIDELSEGISDTKPINTFSNTTESRSEDLSMADHSKLCDMKIEGVKTPSLPSCSNECNAVDEKCPKVKSANCNDGFVAYPNQIPESSAIGSITQHEKRDNKNMSSASTSLREHFNQQKFGISHNHGTPKDSKVGLKENKFSPSTVTPGMYVPKCGAVPLESNINAETGQVPQNSAGISPNVGKVARSISEMQDQPVNLNGPKSHEPAFQPQSSPVSVRRVPKPPMYYPTEVSGPVRHGPCEGQPISSNIPRDNFRLPKGKKFNSGLNIVPETAVSVAAAMHPRVEQLRNPRLPPGAVSKISNLKRDPTFCPEGIKSNQSGDKLQTSLTVGLVEGTTAAAFETWVPGLYGPRHSTPILPSAVTDVPSTRSHMKSPDQGLGSEIFTPEEKMKSQENDSSSDTGMSSLHSQDSGISNPSVVIETWV